MTVGLASDHRGFRMKKALMEYLQEKNIPVTDYGTFSEESCDYTDYAYALGKAVQEKKVARGVLLCYTGIGSAIAVNKVKGVRGALAWSAKTAEMSRRHNNANVLVLPAGFLTQKAAKLIVRKWLMTEFEAGRHLRRVRKITQIEEKEDV